jgi:hypothetical protein
MCVPSWSEKAHDQATVPVTIASSEVDAGDLALSPAQHGEDSHKSARHIGEFDRQHALRAARFGVAECRGGRRRDVSWVHCDGSPSGPRPVGTAAIPVLRTDGPARSQRAQARWQWR